MLSSLYLFSAVFIKVWDEWLLTSAWGVTLALPPRPPSSSSSSSSVVVSEISRVSRPLPLPLSLPLRPCRCILTHTACFFSFWLLGFYLLLLLLLLLLWSADACASDAPPTPPELQLCPQMLLSWRGLHYPQWCKHLRPPHRTLNWGRAHDACSAGCNGCIPGCYCLLHIRRMMSSRAGPSSSSVQCNLGVK